MGALGKAPDQSGNGLTPLDHRHLIWADWHNFGLVSGGEVEGTASMAYKVLPGKVVMRTSLANREAIEVPVPAVTVPTIAAPTTGSRTDWVLLDEDGQVHVQQSNVPTMYPLSVRTVPAGITATTATTQEADRVHAISVNGSLGELGRWDESLGHRVKIPDARQTLRSGRFVLPSDRRVGFHLRHSACENGYTDPIWSTMSGDLTGATLYTLRVDGDVRAKLTFYHGKFWESRVDEIDFELLAGAHDWSLQRERWISEGTSAMTLGGGTSDIPPSHMRVVDQGAIR